MTTTKLLIAFYYLLEDETNISPTPPTFFYEIPIIY